MHFIKNYITIIQLILAIDIIHMRSTEIEEFI